MNELWADMCAAWQQRRRKGSTEKAVAPERAFQRAAAMVNFGLPGRACRQLQLKRHLCAGISNLIKEVAEAFPEIDQLWYLDDCLLCGDPSSVARCVTLIPKKLKAVNLELNTRKCELYTMMEEQKLTELTGIPRVLNQSEWSYQGVPQRSSAWREL